AGIFSGNYTDWSQVPATSATFNPSANISIGRREPGSGTQVIAGSYFLNQGCGDSYAFVTQGGSVSQFTTGGGVEGFVNTTPNSIGINIYKNPAPAGTHYVSINGVAPSAANAALGTYDMAAELTLSKASGLGGNAGLFADALQKIAAKHATVPA